MSDVNVQVEQQNRARLASLTRALQINAFVSGIGMLVFWVSQIGLNHIWGGAKLAYLFILGGLVINAIPIWSKKTEGLFKMKEYEVVTVDGVGNVLSTDSGFQSMQANFFMKIIMLGIMLVFGLVIQPIRIIKMAIQSAVLKRKVKGSTTLLQKGGFLFLLYLLFGFVGLCGGFGIQRAFREQLFKKEDATFVKGVTVIIRYNAGAELYEEANSSAAKLVKIPKGTRFTINDDLVKDSRDWRFFPAEYQGKKGWIYTADCFAILGTGKITVAQEDNLGDTIIPAGTTVNIGEYRKPDPSANDKKARTTGWYVCEYNGVYCSPFVDEIEVSPELKEKLGVKK